MKKKKVSTLITTMVLATSLSLNVYAATQTWKGSPDVEEINQTIPALAKLFEKNQSTINSQKQVIKDKDKAIADKEKQVREKEAVIVQKEKEIAEIEKKLNEKSGVEDLAAQDVKDINAKLKKVYNDNKE